MVTDWPVMTIAECAADEPYATQIGPFGKALTPEAYRRTGVPLLRGVNVNHGRFHDDDFVFISDEDADRLAKFESSPGDVLLVHKGTLGRIGLMPADRRFARYIMGNSMLRVRCDRKKLLPEYLHYWLRSPSGQQYLFSRVSQVGVPQLQRPLTTLREAALPVPSLDEQRAISGVLGTLDNKIEQNQRTARALERLARAIFRAWFVGFEPVKAKAAGATAFPSIPQPVFDALPTRFADSAIGPVPEGWEVGTLGDIAVQRRDGVRPTDIDPETPYIGLEHMPRRSIALTKWEHAGKVTSGKVRFREGQILFGKLRPYFHKVGLAPIDGVCSTDIVVMEPKDSSWLGVVLGHVSSDDFVAHATACSTGTKMPRTNYRDMASYMVEIPPEATAEAFADMVGPMLALLSASTFESRKLAEMRNYLLPKLLSGNVRVSDACETPRNRLYDRKQRT